MTSQPHKDPGAFDFYPERFWYAVEGWPDSEIVRYFRLLCQQWMRDGLPDDRKAMEGMARGKITDRVFEKFPISTDGKRRNNKLEIERGKQRERIAKAKEKSKKMLAARYNKHNGKSCLEATTSSPQVALKDNLPPTTHHPPHSESLSQRARPTMQAAKGNAGQYGVTDEEAEAWWLAREASEWMKGTGGGGTTPVGTNWQADMKTFTNSERERKAREAAKPQRFGRPAIPVRDPSKPIVF